MGIKLKTTIGWIGVFIFIVIISFYIEGFILYSFQGNLGFLLSFFLGPIGLSTGFFGRNESKLIKLLGFYGNICVIVFSFLYWPIGYIVEWLF